MTDANRILKAAVMAYDKCACNCEGCQDYFRPVVVSVLRELAKSYEDPYKVCQEDLIGDELTELADEIEGNSDD